MLLLLTFILFAQTAVLVPGYSSTYHVNDWYWAGSPFCYDNGNLLNPASPAIDTGALIPGFHCPVAGSSVGQPPQSNGQPCIEWFGKAPDIGACEFVTPDMVNPPVPPVVVSVPTAPENLSASQK